MSQVSCKLEGNWLLVRVPACFHRRAGRKEIILPRDVHGESGEPRRNDEMAVTIARAHEWRRLLEEGPFRTLSDLARAQGVDEAYVRRMLRLTLLAPNIIEAILLGSEPSGLSLCALMRAPAGWDEQRRVLGFPEVGHMRLPVAD